MVTASLASEMQRHPAITTHPGVTCTCSAAVEMGACQAAPVMSLRHDHPLTRKVAVMGVATPVTGEAFVPLDVAVLAVPTYWPPGCNVSVPLPGGGGYLTLPAGASPSPFHGTYGRVYTLLVVASFVPVYSGPYTVTLVSAANGESVADGAYTVTIAPGPSHAGSTRLLLDPFWWWARPAEGSIQLRDRWGNVRSEAVSSVINATVERVAVTITTTIHTADGPVTIQLAGGVSYTGSGRFDLDFPCPGTECHVAVTLRGVHVAGSPTSFRRIAGPLNGTMSNAWGPGLEMAVAGAPTYLVVQGRDRHGNRRTFPAPLPLLRQAGDAVRIDGASLCPANGTVTTRVDARNPVGAVGTCGTLAGVFAVEAGAGQAVPGSPGVDPALVSNHTVTAWMVRLGPMDVDAVENSLSWPTGGGETLRFNGGVAPSSALPPGDGCRYGGNSQWHAVPILPGGLRRGCGACVQPPPAATASRSVGAGHRHHSQSRQYQPPDT